MGFLREGLRRTILTAVLVVLAGYAFAVGFTSYSTNSRLQDHAQDLQEQLDQPIDTQDIPAADTLGEEEEKLDPVKLIFDHVLDSHEWHLFTIGHTHVTVPLPIIVYSRYRGEWHFFMSSRFHHGHTSYAGFKLDMPIDGGKATIVEDVTPAEGEIIPKPIDISITRNVVGIFFSCGLLLLIFIPIAKRYRENPNRPPKGVQGVMEPLIFFIRDNVAVPSIGKKADKFMPFLLTIFFFILLNNLLGLIPIIPAGANLTGNITVTLVLAMFTFLMTTFSGNKNYWRHIVDTPGVPVFLKVPVPLMPVVEIASMFTKPVVLMIRLFANMLSGHMIVLVFLCVIFLFKPVSDGAAYGMSVISLFFAVFMTLLDVLISFIQAYVFTMLSALYFGMATHEAEH